MAQRSTSAGWIAAGLTLLLASGAWAGVPKKRSEDHVRGKELWDRSCWQCHGKLGAGDGPAAEALGVPVPDLRGQVSDDRYDALVQVIIKGQGKMPAFKAELDQREARRILVYLERLETHPPPGKPLDAPDKAADDAPLPERVGPAPAPAQVAPAPTPGLQPPGPTPTPPPPPTAD